MSKELSVDDILNASDSDDDNEKPYGTGGGIGVNNAIDLETLLEAEDDDDEEDERDTDLAAVGGSSVVSTLSAATSSLASTGATAVTAEASAKVESSAASTATAPANLDKPASAVALFQTPPPPFPPTQSTVSLLFNSTSSKGKSDLHLSALQLADSREQRFLSQGNRDIIPTLQSRLNWSDNNTGIAGRNDVIDSVCSSNLKCSELFILSSQLARNASYKNHGPGIATVVHVHHKFIAIGTSRGLLLLFDHGEEIRQVIGSSVANNSRCTASVTAIDVTDNGLLALCGYETGEVALWDVAKGSCLKRITDLHRDLLVRLRFIWNAGESSIASTNTATTNSNDIHAISVDSRGCVHRIRFSKMLWTNYSTEAECLLDGSAGAVTDMSTLVPFSNVPIQSPEIWWKSLLFQPTVQFVALNSTTRTYIVQVQPMIRIRYRWAAPPCVLDPVTGGHRPECVAAIDWSWSAVHPSDIGVPVAQPLAATLYHPVLARVWGNTVQLLMVANTPREDSQSYHLVADRTFDRGTSSSALLANSGSNKSGESGSSTNFLSVKWLSPGSTLAVLSLTDIFILRRNLDVIEVAVLLPMITTNLRAVLNSRRSLDEAYRPIISAHSKKLYVLTPEQLFYLYVQSWMEQVDQLISAGNWLEALSTTLYYWSKRKIEERESSGDGTYIDRYIMKYLDLAVSQPPVNLPDMLPGVSAALGSSSSASNTTVSTARNHFHLVAGVCIEYCLAAERQELLFSDIFTAFTTVRQHAIFVESLEPFILSGVIKKLPQHIVFTMMEVNKHSHRYTHFERCLVHLNLEDNDVDEVISFLTMHKLYSGLLYVQSMSAKQDFAGAFERVFDMMLQPSPVGSSAEPSTSGTSFPTPLQANVAYRLLLFLDYTATGWMFPRRIAPSSGKTYSATGQSPGGFAFPKQPLCLLAESLISRKLVSSSILDEDSPNSQVPKRYPYLTCLTAVDPSATIICGTKLISRVQQFTLAALEGSVSTHTVPINNPRKQVPSADESAYLFSELGDFLCTPNSAVKIDAGLQTLFLEQAYRSIIQCSSPLSIRLISMTLAHISVSVRPRSQAEALVEILAINQSLHESVVPELRSALMEKGFWRAAYFLHNRSEFGYLPEEFTAGVRHYLSLLGQSKAVISQNPAEIDPSLNQCLFQYIDDTFTVLTSDGVPSATQTLFTKALVSLLVDLAKEDLESTQRVTEAYLIEEVGPIIAQCQKFPAVLFALLDALVRSCRGNNSAGSNNSISSAGSSASSSSSGGAGHRGSVIATAASFDAEASSSSSSRSNNSNARKFADVFSQQEMMTYIRQLLTFQPKRLFAFLSSTDYYPLDEVLVLTRGKEEVQDSTAFLLERSGDALGALNLLQADLTRNLVLARKDIEKQFRLDSLHTRQSITATSVGKVPTASSSRSLASQILSKQGAVREELARQLSGYADCLHVLDCITGLCMRHDSGSKADNSMWFVTFDRLLTERQNMRLGTMSSTTEVMIVLIGQLLHNYMDVMKTVVPPQDIVKRVAVTNTSSTGGSGLSVVGVGGVHSGPRYSEFKDVMITMVDTYRDELFQNELLLRMHAGDVNDLHRRKYWHMRRGARMEAGQTDTGDTEHTMNKPAAGAISGGAGRRKNRKFRERQEEHSVHRLREVLRSRGKMEFSVTLPTAPPLYLPYLDHLGSGAGGGDESDQRAPHLRRMSMDATYNAEYGGEMVF